MQSRFPGLDRFDQAILRELSHNGRSSVSDLARAIGLSKSPTQARLKRLETEGIIQGYRAMIDPIRLGLDHVAFVEVKLTDTREAAPNPQGPTGSGHVSCSQDGRELAPTCRGSNEFSQNAPQKP
ncbi:transcriptional regulator, AsnC family [Ruegeria sp. TrichCH4B]|nr:transcriptional regulator, AsnC family [Ruegeria sp. TrichCH4B]